MGVTNLMNTLKLQKGWTNAKDTNQDLVVLNII